jgi:hypothetical protein
MPTGARSADAVLRGRPTTADWVAVGGIAALVTAAAFPVGHAESGPVLCPFRRLTGLPCPGCGMTRSWIYLTHGDWHAAFAANPFGPLVALAVVALAVTVVRERAGGRRPPDFERLVRSRWVLPVVVAWLVFGVVRAVLTA